MMVSVFSELQLMSGCRSDPRRWSVGGGGSCRRRTTTSWWGCRRPAQGCALTLRFKSKVSRRCRAGDEACRDPHCSNGQVEWAAAAVPSCVAGPGKAICDADKIAASC